MARRDKKQSKEQNRVVPDEEIENIPDMATYKRDGKWIPSNFEFTLNDKNGVGGLLGVEVFNGTFEDFNKEQKTKSEKKPSEKSSSTNDDDFEVIAVNENEGEEEDMNEDSMFLEDEEEKKDKKENKKNKEEKKDKKENKKEKPVKQEKRINPFDVDDEEEEKEEKKKEKKEKDKKKRLFVDENGKEYDTSKIIHCDVCNMDIKGENIWQQHIQGKKHCKKAGIPVPEQKNHNELHNSILSKSAKSIEGMTQIDHDIDHLELEDNDYLNSDYDEDENNNNNNENDDTMSISEEEEGEEEDAKDFDIDAYFNEDNNDSDIEIEEDDKTGNNVDVIYEDVEEDKEEDVEEEEEEEEKKEEKKDKKKEKKEKKEEKEVLSNENDSKHREHIEVTENTDFTQCTLCKLHFTNKNQYFMHQYSKLHKKNVASQGVPKEVTAEKKTEKKAEKEVEKVTDNKTENKNEKKVEKKVENKNEKPKAKTQSEKDEERKKKKQEEIENIRGTKEAKELYTGIAWEDLYIPENIISTLKKYNYNRPTDIQVQCIRAYGKGNDILGAAPTGSGKTLAFLLPIIMDILKNKKREEKEQYIENNNNKEEEEKKKSMEIEGEEDHNKEDKENTELLPHLKFLEKFQKVDKKKDWKISSILCAPTRELCVQTYNVLQQLTKDLNITSVCIVGGLSEQKQLRMINKCPDIIIGTVGRLWWLFDEQHVTVSNISKLRHLVIDEADKMVVAGAYPELQKFVRYLKNAEAEHPNPVRKTYLFSATLSLSDTSISASPVKQLLFNIAVQSKHQICVSNNRGDEQVGDESNLEQSSHILPAGLTCLHVKVPGDMEKENFIYGYMQKYKGHTLVFVNSINTLKSLYGVLSLLHLPIYRLYAGMQQKQRLNTINKFKNSNDALLLSTDVASRGIDIPDVTCVIHYHMPFSPQLFVHRSGRTARAGKEGVSISLVTPREQSLYQDVCTYVGHPNGFSEFPNETQLTSNKINLDRLELCHKIFDITDATSKRSHDSQWLEKNRKLIEEEEEEEENNNSNKKNKKDKKKNMKNDDDSDNEEEEEEEEEEKEEKKEKKQIEEAVVLTREQKLALKVLRKNLDTLLTTQNSLLPYRGSFITTDPTILQTLRTATKSGVKRNIVEDCKEFAAKRGRKH